jgi:hypothetical protein
VKINEELEMTLEKFIPVLHLKIITIVDITGTIGRIKQLIATMMMAMMAKITAIRCTPRSSCGRKSK